MRLSIRFVPLLVLLVIGCGGADPLQSGTRGDGSIPVGRAKGPTRAPVDVVVLASDGTSFSTRTVEGDVFLPNLPSGLTKFTFEGADRGSEAKTLQLLLSPNQGQIFDVNLPPRGQSARVDRVWFANASPLVLRVGETAKLQFRFEGTGVNGVGPTIWIEGGVGAINPGNVYRAVSPGVGKAYGELFGVTTSLDIIVTE